MVVREGSNSRFAAGWLSSLMFAAGFLPVVGGFFLSRRSSSSLEVMLKKKKDSSRD